MMWERVKLADVSDSCLGKMLDQRKNKGIYKPYLANVNVRWGAFDLDNLQEMKFEDDEDERYGIKYGDLIICEGGEPGRCAIWKEQLPNMKIQKALHRLRVNEEMDYRYVYYWFLLAGKQGALKQYYTGATIMHMPGQKLKEVVIDKPPLDVQRKIGDYLEAFDDLIENNQKQIKLLEEAAQRLYKEWFVDLRFPGYEDVEIVDGVPEGWKEEKLIDIANVQYGFAFDSSLFNSQGKGKQIIRIRNIPSGITDDYTTQEADEQYIVSNGDIVVGMDGEFHINSWCGKTAYLVQRTCKFIPKKELMRGWLLQAIYGPIKYFEKTVVGATVAHLGKKHIDTIELLTGPDELYIPFKTLFDKRQLLLNQNILLSEARDRLLPKLMSGEIEV
ncbi:restriction endonuclease subunit S [Anaerotignum faecicola]|jgi:type I restriction enzyme S subunit